VAKESGRGLGSKIACHADNACPVTAKKIAEFVACSGMKRTPYPRYSPDLAPCDFYLFGYIKGRLAGASFEDLAQLLQAIDAIFQSIEKHIGTRFSGVDAQIGAMLYGR
jgi:hypothetical protein